MVNNKEGNSLGKVSVFSYAEYDLMHYENTDENNAARKSEQYKSSRSENRIEPKIAKLTINWIKGLNKMSSLTKIFLMLTIVVVILVFDHYNSQPKNNIHSSAPILLPLVKISNDSVIQSAYEVCRNDSISGAQKDNPSMPRGLLISTIKSMPDACKGMIEGPCKSGLSDKMCQFIIKPYQ